MSAKSQHLNDDMIIKAIVDETDLSSEALAHLSGCKECFLKKEALAGDLSHFTSLAHEATPQPQRMIILEEAAKDNDPLHWFSPAFATVIIVMIILAGLSFLLPGSKPHIAEKTFTLAELTTEMEKHSLFVSEVMELEENIMPEIYTALTGNADSDQYDEFMEFVFPLGEGTNGV
jgi:hypothetical protein